MNKTDMRAPARLPAIDLRQFRLSLISGPQHAEVIIEISQRRKLLAQLARAYVAVVIDHHRRFACCTRKRPRGWLFKVCMLRAVMCDDRVRVSGILHETLAR